MSTIDLAFRRLQDANPEPDPQALLRSVTSPERGPEGRPMSMDQISTESRPQEQESPTTRRGWLTAAVAALAVVVALIAIPTLTSDTPYADMTDAELATALIAGEVDPVSEIVSPDAEFDIPSYTGGYADIDRYIEFTERIGNENTDIVCTDTGTGIVVCNWRMTNTVTRALGMTPAFANNRLVFEDGQIVGWTSRSNLQWGDFFEWLPADAAATMFTVTESGVVIHVDDTALAAWEENVEAYAASVAGQG